MDCLHEVEVLKNNKILFGCYIMSNSSWPHGLQHTRLPHPSLSPGICSNSCPLSQWCHPTVSSSVAPFPPALSLSQHQSLFQCQLFTSGVAKALKVQWIFLPMNIQDWFPYDWLVWSSCCSRDSQESSPASQFKTISSSVLSLLYGPTLTSIHDYWKNHSFDYTDLCQQSDVSAFFNMLSRFVIAFLPRSKHFLISWLPSLPTVILEPKKIKSFTVSIFSPSTSYEMMGLDVMISVFWMSKPAFSLSSFTPIKMLFSLSYNKNSRENKMK